MPWCSLRQARTPCDGRSDRNRAVRPSISGLIPHRPLMLMLVRKDMMAISWPHVLACTGPQPISPEACYQPPSTLAACQGDRPVVGLWSPKYSAYMPECLSTICWLLLGWAILFVFQVTWMAAMAVTLPALSPGALSWGFVLHGRSSL